MVRVLIAVLVIPLGLDLYVSVPEENPITLERIDLGRRLFHDRRLSRDQSVACVSCHDPDRAFSTAEAVTPGVFGRRGKRNAPALINRAWGRSFFWDARIATLEEQVLQPIEDAKEMDLSIDEASRRVGVAVPDMSRALATYIRSIMSGNAPYDGFVNGDRTALSAEAQIGLQVFRGIGNCSACHIAPNFTDEKLHNTGVPGQQGQQLGRRDRFLTRAAGRSPGGLRIVAHSRRQRCVRSSARRLTCMTGHSRRCTRLLITTIAAGIGTRFSTPKCSRSASLPRKSRH